MSEKRRCAWVDDSDIYKNYHDHEWGVPTHDDQKLFEMLLLESFQAGLSWITILKKREAFREAFDQFDPEKIARYDHEKVEQLMQNPGIVRNRLKILAAINNAQLFLKLQGQEGSFDKWLWNYVEGSPIVGHWEAGDTLPATSELSDKLSADLKKLGFKFVGSTIIYSFMQAIGMIDDHIKTCFRYAGE